MGEKLNLESQSISRNCPITVVDRFSVVVVDCTVAVFTVVMGCTVVIFTVVVVFTVGVDDGTVVNETLGDCTSTVGGCTVES